MSTPSRSNELRQEGNVRFASAMHSSVGGTLREQRLGDAIAVYRQAWHAATNADQRASCAKNIAQCHRHILERYIEDEVQWRSCAKDHLRYHGTEFATAVRDGVLAGQEAHKSAEWLTDVEATGEKLADALMEALTGREDELRVRCDLLRQVCQPFKLPAGRSRSRLGAKLFYQLSQTLWKHAVKLGDVRDGALSIEGVNATVEANECIERSRLLLRGHEALHPESVDLVFADEISDMAENIRILHCSFQSMLFRHQGDVLLTEFDPEDTSGAFMDAMWRVADLYTQGIVGAREIDLECEAIALCRLGRLYRKAFKREAQGHAYYLKAVELAGSMKPKIVTNTSWHKEATEAIEAHRQKLFAADREEEERRRAPFLEMLKTELEELRVAADKAPRELLEFLYEKHPPKGGEKMPNTTSLKKDLVRAISHYHRDKQVGCEEKWIVFAEEITKKLNGIYETYKFV